MWYAPSPVIWGNANTTIGTVQERIRALIADGVDPNGNAMVLEELRAAGTLLPQTKGHVLRIGRLEYLDWYWRGLARYIGMLGGGKLNICEMEGNLDICRNHLAKLKDRLFAHL